MKKISVLSLSLLFSFVLYGQTRENLDERKGQLFFKVGTEYRITPLPVRAGEIPEVRFTNPEEQNRGVAIHYGIDFFATQNLSLGFANSFRHTLLNYSDRLIVDGSTGQDKAEYALFVGYHFNATYHFKIFKEAELFVRLGKSLLNRGSSFKFIDPIFDENGELLVTRSSQINYHMQTNNFAVGYKRDKFEIILGAYGTSDAPYFDRSVGYIIPYINLAYTLGKL